MMIQHYFFSIFLPSLKTILHGNGYISQGHHVFCVKRCPMIITVGEVHSVIQWWCLFPSCVKIVAPPTFQRLVLPLPLRGPPPVLNSGPSLPKRVVTPYLNKIVLSYNRRPSLPIKVIPPYLKQWSLLTFTSGPSLPKYWSLRILESCPFSAPKIDPFCAPETTWYYVKRLLFPYLKEWYLLI